MEHRPVKSLAQASFFRAFDLLLGTTNPGLKWLSWKHDGVAWEREKHAFTGSKYSLAIEVVTLTRPGKRGWSLMIVKEYWWVGKQRRAEKAVRWAKTIEGERSDVMQWFRAQAAALDRPSPARAVFAANSAKVGEPTENISKSEDFE
jgi:hypothetical protein